MKYNKEDLENKVKECLSWRQLLFKCGLKEGGGSYTTLQRKCKEFNIDTSHFLGQGWNKPEHECFGNSIDLSKRLCLQETKKASSKTKEIVLNHGLKENRCEKCGLTDWMGEPITLHLHHINGNPKDDRIENLQILCPNCHSQTNSYCKREQIRNHDFE